MFIKTLGDLEGLDERSPPLYKVANSREIAFGCNNDWYLCRCLFLRLTHK